MSSAGLNLCLNQNLEENENVSKDHLLDIAVERVTINAKKIIKQLLTEGPRIVP